MSNATDKTGGPAANERPRVPLQNFGPALAMSAVLWALILVPLYFWLG